MQTVPHVKLDHPATYDDLIAQPDHVVAEILDDELFVSPRPAPKHARAASRLAGVLISPFDLGSRGPGGWIILHEPELHLRRDVLVPDIAGWRRERMPRLPETAYFPLAPDWVCEVLSPATATIDRAKKLRIYAREGVGHAWLVDPLARTLEVLRLENGRWAVLAVHAGGETVREEPFDPLAIDLNVLWGEPEGPPTPAADAGPPAD